MTKYRKFDMNSHLLTQEERDYFINLYKEYGIKEIGIEDYGTIYFSDCDIHRIPGDEHWSLISKMQEIFFRLEFHFEITMSEINGEVDIDLRISGEGIKIKDGMIDLDHWIANN
jgi:hypothetical protein